MSRSTLLGLGTLTVLGIGIASVALSAHGPGPGPRPEALSSSHPVLVMSRHQVSATLRGARLRSLGGRQFVVGDEIPSPYTKVQFQGGTVWIPLEDVTQLVELGALPSGGR